MIKIHPMSATPNQRAVYSIGAVGRMLGLSPATIRNWEERYGVVQPERSPGGHRLYSRDQVDQLRFIRAEIARGAQAADAHRALAERLDSPPGADHRPVGESSPELLILLAERDPYAAELSEFFLRTEGYVTAVAFDPDEAVRAVAERRPALAVVELLIAGGAGAELCRRLKATSTVPILAVSTLDAREVAIAAGADAFLGKPLEPLQLVSAVKDLLGASAYLRPQSAAG
jgi:CheY-like chemotaxis protein